MPPRHYRFRLRNPVHPITILQTYSNVILPTLAKDTFQTQLFDIIEIITQRLEIAEITLHVTKLVDQISTSIELNKLLDTVETISLSIVQNITDGVDIGIVRCRIDYLRSLISEIPDGSQEEYAQVGKLILGVLAMISDGIDHTLVNDKLVDIKSSVDICSNVFTVITEIEYIICSIVQNITDGVDIGIVRCRFDYLKGLIGKLSEGVQPNI